MSHNGLCQIPVASGWLEGHFVVESFLAGPSEIDVQGGLDAAASQKPMQSEFLSNVSEHGL